MRLTVGPLPAAVYWRRRAVVLVGLAGVVLVTFYACGGASGSTANPDVGASPRSAGGSAAPSPATTLLRPSLPTAPATPGSGGPAIDGPVTACTDADLQLTASARPGEVRQRAAVDLTIKIKNVATRTCSRDVGADVQELRVVQGATIIWSSDDCNPNRGHDVAVLPPGKEVTFTITWTGRVSRAGTDSGRLCDTDKVPLPGSYQVIARLDQILSEPEPLTIMP